MFSVPQIICPSCSATMPYTAAACPGCKRRMVGVGYPARSPGPRKPPDLGPTPFVECRAPGCHYFVTASDTVCPNCGADEPSRAGRRGRLGAFLKARDSQGLLFSLILLIFTAVLLAFYALDGGDRALPWVIVVGGFASAAAGWGLTRLLRRAFDLAGAGGGAAAAGSGALRHSETTIMQRLVEIRRRGQQVEAALARAHPEAVGRMAEAREALKGARQLLRRQHARYGMKLVEIEAARWQNGLAPLIHNLGELTFEQNENRLRALDAAVAEGARLRSKAEKHREALGDGGEVEEFARKVSETLESCARIREALAG
ncbi:MAG TPA: hypothetical protein VD968_03435, partial [Pyrinomonadaceae bacterium]|nr:hypothetical protein [Pyrinomonadaceae bacterium]